MTAGMEVLGTVARVFASADLGLRTVQHLEMFGLALAVTLAAGILLGVLFFSSAAARAAGIPLLSAVEMVPEVALLVLLIPLAGVGAGPTVTAAVLYSVLPVAQNTAAGLAGTDPGITGVARAIGLSEREILLRVRFPLALPLVFSGVRIAAVFCMGIVTLGGIVGAGGLGAPIQTGLTTGDNLLILVAGLWVTFLAVLVDAAAWGIGRLASRRAGGYP